MTLLSSIALDLVAITLVYLALPQFLAALPPRPQFLCKSALMLFMVAVTSFLGCAVSIVYALLNRRSEINFVVSRLYTKLTARPCGVSFKVSGEHYLEDQRAVVVCNHQSTLDLMVIGKVFPKHCVVMAKKELLYVPLLGLYMKLSNAIFVDRKNHKKAIESSTHAVADMKKRNSGIWIFPEGTRSRLDTADLLPFKKGAFHLAIQSQYPIIPIVSEAYSHIYDSSRRLFPGGELEIRVLEPIPTTGMTTSDVNELMEKTREVMLKHLKEMDALRTSSSTLAKKELIQTAVSSAVALGDEGTEILKKRTAASQ
ncbi:1-acylglycerol-3-phosphate O-acyltransferase [Lunasporangiospora selenospora]|uniref:1-acyl-sn-glycerol-3-phosphate acyltransferase n=1 Tax=Lunasporangiospora selenospora TaxID=979761 RepID=A0A9P6FZZ2_9FUNG|nr:1-acylglycerol-3-phosphate O-acyltransferase [Lunasporangiospora selenospora]